MSLHGRIPLKRALNQLIFRSRGLYALAGSHGIHQTRRCVTTFPLMAEARSSDSQEDEDYSATDKTRANRAITPVGVPRRIHILGLGSLGKLVAYHLAGIPNRPPISLLLHKHGTIEAWRRCGEIIKLERNGQTDSRKGYDQDSAMKPANEALLQEQVQDPIHNLIVTLKGPMTAKGLSSIAHRIVAESSIVFLQNGMGIIDEVNEKVFPDPETRPNYIMGVVSHGVYSTSQFEAKHAGLGTIALSVLRNVPFEEVYPMDTDAMLLPQSARYLIRTLTRTPALAAVAYPPPELFQLQLEKLAVNAVVNPLTAILGCFNGELLHNLHATRTMRLLLAEISLVIRNLPELQGQPNISNRFSPNRLESIVVGVLEDTARNVSSMLQDVRKSQITEISYINGWFVRRGEDLGFRCVVNYAVMQLLETKSWLTFKHQTDELPFERR